MKSIFSGLNILSRQLLLFGIVGLLAGAAQAEQPNVDQRIAALRAKAQTLASGPDATTESADATGTGSWCNWYNWSNWNNWHNWQNWGNAWSNWCNY